MALKNSPFAPDTLKARFAELNELKSAGEKELEPAIRARDKILARSQAALEEANDVIREIRERHSLYEIDQERATIVRALGGSQDRGVRTAEGSAPEAEEVEA